MKASIKIIVYDNCISEWLDTNNRKEAAIEEVAQYLVDINIFKKTANATAVRKLKHDITKFHKDNQMHRFKRIDVLKVQGNNHWMVRRK